MNDLPLVDTLGISGDFDDDAFILGKSTSSDEKASVDVDKASKSMGESRTLILYDIGVDATDKSLNYFKSRSVDISKDYPYLYVLTSAGHVEVNGLKTNDVLNGILDTLGSKFNRKHLKSVDNPSWKDLVFYFTVVKNTKKISYALKYDSDLFKLVELNGNDGADEKSNSIHYVYNAQGLMHGDYISNESDVNKTKVNVNNSTGNNINVSENSNKSNKSSEVSLSHKEILLTLYIHWLRF